ncbi:MAG: hypothetical protein AB1726_05180 [Planctomycetota bacterium]
MRSRVLGSYGRFGLLLIGIGLLLAIDTLAGLYVLHKLWPLLVTLLGVGFLGIYIRRSRRESEYVGIAAFLLGSSAVAMYCSLTTWTALATLWPLFIGVLGASFLAGFAFGGRSPLPLLIGLLLISLCAVFLFVLAIDVRLWWMALVLAGASFLVFARARPPE